MGGVRTHALTIMVRVFYHCATIAGCLHIIFFAMTLGGCISSATTLSITTFSIITFSIMTLSIMTLSIMTLSITIKMRYSGLDNVKLSVVMLNVI
jgi:hypothetical protein